MHRNGGQTAREENNKWIKRFEHLTKVLQTSKGMQLRYQLIPSHMLNKTCVAGIRDTTLGQLRNGQPTGGNVVRVNNPSVGTKSDFPRICIDPKGVSNKNNPHIEVSAGTVKVAETTQKVLKVSGKVLLVVSIIASGVRIGKAIYDEVNIDDEIKAIEDIILCLKYDLENEKNVTETEKALETARKLLDDARDCKQRPGKKSIVTSLCIGGEWLGGAALAYAGAEAGAAVGALGGPVGSIGGAVTGGIIGAVCGSELGASAVQNFQATDDGVSTDLQGSLVSFGEVDKAKFVPIDSNFFVGKGVEVGARASLFEISNEDAQASLKLGKVGGNVGVTSQGADIGVEAKAVWTEKETDDYKFGFGVNVDTGFKANAQGVDFSLLGFGFNAGDNGAGFKTPFFNFTWK